MLPLLTLLLFFVWIISSFVCGAVGEIGVAVAMEEIRCKCEAQGLEFERY